MVEFLRPHSHYSKHNIGDSLSPMMTGDELGAISAKDDEHLQTFFLQQTLSSHAAEFYTAPGAKHCGKRSIPGRT